MPNTKKPSRTAYLDALRTKVQEMSSPGKATKSYKDQDDRFWKPEVDKTGKGSAIIRFLPPVLNDEANEKDICTPFVRLWSHGFQGPTGKWLIDNCPTTIEENCPVCDSNRELWNSADEKLKAIVSSSRKRRLKYISNILVVNDPKHPENNGKVFLYQYGKQIFDMIAEQINPPSEFADMDPVDPINPFSMEEGANFRLRIMRVDNFPSYKKSEFEAPSAIGDEDEIARIESQLIDLQTILDPKNFKSYDDLNKRLLLATGEAAESSNSGSKPGLDDDGDFDEPVAEPKQQRAATAAPKRTAPPKAAPAVEDDTDDDDYFAKLAAQADDE